MGACFSHLELEDPCPTAKVVSATGDLHEYPVPVTVSQVLHSECDHPQPSPSSSSSSASAGYFLCNSDGLCYEERIPALPRGEELLGDQIYFVLPESKLEGRLTVQEMAAMAVKASLAMRKADEKGRRGGGGGGRRKRRKSRKTSIRISPVVEVSKGVSYNDGVMMSGGYYGNENSVGGRRSSSGSGNGSVLRSGSFRKTQRAASSKGSKIRVRPYRTMLCTIHEGVVM